MLSNDRAAKVETELKVMLQKGLIVKTRFIKMDLFLLSLLVTRRVGCKNYARSVRSQRAFKIDNLSTVIILILKIVSWHP